uniref:Uncharacterized protein n=1 Tax=Chenopodium quinoa TaxID=63459 RepID=A0A803KWK3_CHEQI
MQKRKLTSLKERASVHVQYCENLCCGQILGSCVVCMLLRNLPGETITMLEIPINLNAEEISALLLKFARKHVSCNAGCP